MLDIPPCGSFVKICGITCREDADLCAESGAAAIGINFFPKSKRFHSMEQAKRWLGAFSGPGFPARVALFVNATFEEIKVITGTGLFEAVQLHGDESPAFCASVRALGFPVIRALALQTADDLPLLAGHPADAFILDAWVPGVYGGTGELANWSLAAEAVRRFPHLPILLSGGLTAENVAAAVAEVRPAGVDVASGVETAPGHKDSAKVRAFITAAKPKAPIPD